MHAASVQEKLLRLCRGKEEELSQSLYGKNREFLWWLGIIWLAGGAYGACIGIGRAPLQGLYTAVKFPLILCLILFGNALLNSLIAGILGIPLPFRHTLQVLAMCFALFSLILASLVPVLWFITWNLPDVSAVEHSGTYRALLLFHVVLIALAGCASHFRLFELIKYLCGDLHKARTVLILWLAGNLLLGSQLSWNLRPFFGSPHLEVGFVRENAFEKNFFEAVADNLQLVLKPNPPKGILP